MSDFTGFARGCLIVSNEFYQFVNNHLRPQHARKHDTLTIVKQLPSNKINFVAGDFNQQLRDVRQNLPGFLVPGIGKTYGEKQLDHIITDAHPIRWSTFLEDANLTSDHHLIGMDVVL